MMYLLRILLAVDQLINTLLGGYADETISYRAALANQNGEFLGCIFCRVAEWFIKDHCDLHKISKAEKLSRGDSYMVEHGHAIRKED